ncbi:hypothetical protein BGZ99_005221 [Dissophora globulifera]|uniref:Uncharacterized protein n=1 Tax=Dissophora globulifera TaxID=979702 RepID=A0A9P6RHR0_9FUNG|nr:hypothetical protein BGZ99_005221 [Dissophora globulifera]
MPLLTDLSLLNFYSCPDFNFEAIIIHIDVRGRGFEEVYWIKTLVRDVHYSGAVRLCYIYAFTVRQLQDISVGGRFIFEGAKFNNNVGNEFAIRVFL